MIYNKIYLESILIFRDRCGQKKKIRKHGFYSNLIQALWKLRVDIGKDIIHKRVVDFGIQVEL